jgi:rod shape-determining protein MreD
MQNKNFKNRLWIYSSLVFAIILDTYLFPEAVMQWKPLLVLLTLIYWNMALPDKVGIFEALLFGLIMDLLNGSVFGLHGLLFVLITYICQRFFYQFRVSPIWQQSVILFFLFFVFKMAFAFDLYDVTLGIYVSDSFYLLNSFGFALVSSIFWTPLFYLLRELRRRKIQL